MARLRPEAIVRIAVEAGVGAISVTDHDAVEGTLRAEPLARAAGLLYVHGVEIDTLWEGRDVHVLAYGADFENARLMGIIREARACMDAMSDRLLARMRADFPALDAAEYADFQRDVSLGGWKLLHYLMEKGVTRAMTEGMRFYAQYGVTYGAGRLSPRERSDRGHPRRRGKAVLAHPGVTLARAENFPPRPLPPGRRRGGRRGVLLSGAQPRS